MPTKKASQSQNQIRMDEPMKVRVRKYQLQLEKDTGMKVSFSSATRSLIAKGLDVVGVR